MPLCGRDVMIVVGVGDMVKAVCETSGYRRVE